MSASAAVRQCHGHVVARSATTASAQHRGRGGGCDYGGYDYIVGSQPLAHTRGGGAHGGAKGCWWVLGGDPMGVLGVLWLVFAMAKMTSFFD